MNVSPIGADLVAAVGKFHQAAAAVVRASGGGPRSLASEVVDFRSKDHQVRVTSAVLRRTWETEKHLLDVLA